MQEDIRPGAARIIAEAIHRRRAILFAGAGLSMIVGLPSWQELIQKMGEELEIDPSEVLGPDTSYHTLAEYYRVKKGTIGPLRSWLDRHWNVREEVVRASEVHAILAELDFPVIYTTNFDRNIEIALKAHGRDFEKIATARDIAVSRRGVTHVVKFHGDFDDDRSMVLAETDYFDRLAFSSPLDARFLADALGNTVLFVGYSMTDLNIRLLLHRMRQTWRQSGYERDRPPSFVFMAAPNPVQETVLEQWGVTAIPGRTEDPGGSLVMFLREVRDELGRMRAEDE